MKFSKFQRETVYWKKLELPGAEFFVRMELDIWLNFRKTWSWIKYSYIQKLLETIIRSLKDKENYIFKNC